MRYLKNRRVVKDARDILRHARHVRNMYEDVLTPQRLEHLTELEQRLVEILKTRDISAIKKVSSDAIEFLGEITPKHSHPRLRENVEILLVAIVVAMGFRTYFIQPFKIPTGSMQPSLYGITSVTHEDPGVMDWLPVRPVKWIVTGEWYHRIEARHTGFISLMSQHQRSSDPSRVYFVVRGVDGSEFTWVERLRRGFLRLLRRNPDLHWVPIDAYRNRRETCVAQDVRVEKGQVLWSGTRYAGDHVFVDKIRWNFLPPRRGEIMVFSTKNITGLPENMHYIKRMVGLPNEKISIDPPHLLVDGVRVRKPKAVRRIADMEDEYKGYQCVEPYGILSSPDRNLPLGDRQYCAMGDNTFNSRDGRYWGAVPEENLVGPAFAVYWPFTRGQKRGRWGMTCWR